MNGAMRFSLSQAATQRTNRSGNGHSTSSGERRPCRASLWSGLQGSEDGAGLGGRATDYEKPLRCSGPCSHANGKNQIGSLAGAAHPRKCSEGVLC